VLASAAPRSSEPRLRQPYAIGIEEQARANRGYLWQRQHNPKTFDVRRCGGGRRSKLLHARPAVSRTRSRARGAATTAGKSIMAVMEHESVTAHRTKMFPIKRTATGNLVESDRYTAPKPSDVQRRKIS
jgi:hypothetical protein